MSNEQSTGLHEMQTEWRSYFVLLIRFPQEQERMAADTAAAAAGEADDTADDTAAGDGDVTGAGKPDEGGTKSLMMNQ